MQITRRQRQSGITMVESCCAMSIAAVLVGAGVPSFKDTLVKRNLEGTASQVALDVLFARSEAVSRNQSVRVTFSRTAAGTCYVLHTGARDDCSCGDGGAAACIDGARAFKSVLVAAGSGVRIEANVSSMLFDAGRGTTTPAGTVRTVADDGRAIHHVVNIMGRPRACSPNGAVSGYKRC